MRKSKPFGVAIKLACCGRTRFKRHWTLTERQLNGCTLDCPYCDELLIVWEFLEPRDVVPQVVLTGKFHEYINSGDPAWPKDGFGADYVDLEFQNP